MVSSRGRTSTTVRSTVLLLRTPAAGSIGFGITLFFMVGFTMDCGAQLLAVPVLVQSVLLLGGLPSKAMSPSCPGMQFTSYSVPFRMRCFREV